MFFLRLMCRPADAELLSAELWEAGTAGIQEMDTGDGALLLAGFETNERREELLRQFAAYSPQWEHEDATDWVKHTQEAWPPRCIGERFFLAAPWREEATPRGRYRIVHNPGLACGTGEHPCTQLALEALEESVQRGHTVLDVGTGSGLLAIAALYLGASRAVGLDTDEAALQAARENFELNGFAPLLAVGSADAVRSGVADVVVANISATVLLAIADDLLRITKPGGVMVMTGFPEWELPALEKEFARRTEGTKILAMNEWRCLAAKLKVPSPAV